MICSFRKLIKMLKIVAFSAFLFLLKLNGYLLEVTVQSEKSK